MVRGRHAFGWLGSDLCVSLRRRRRSRTLLNKAVGRLPLVSTRGGMGWIEGGGPGGGRELGSGC